MTPTPTPTHHHHQVKLSEDKKKKIITTKWTTGSGRARWSGQLKLSFRAVWDSAKLEGLQEAASEDRSWPWIFSSYRQVSMQADRVRPGREGGREEGEDGAVLEEASSFHRSISLSLARSESPFLLFHLHLPGTGMCQNDHHLMQMEGGLCLRLFG